MNVADINLNHSLIPGIFSRYGGVSSIEKICRRWETASGQQIDRVRASLENVFLDCFSPNWDGYDATPISKEAYLEAGKLLDLLPLYFPLPEIVPEPTGDMAMEWHKENQFTFVLSVSGNNTISYAGIFGHGNETHGTENFTESIPRIIIDNIRRLFPA